MLPPAHENDINPVWAAFRKPLLTQTSVNIKPAKVLIVAALNKDCLYVYICADMINTIKRQPELNASNTAVKKFHAFFVSSILNTTFTTACH
jgi:hypothetical protein